MELTETEYEIRVLNRELEAAWQELGKLRAENADLRADLAAAQVLARGLKHAKADYYRTLAEGVTVPDGDVVHGPGFAYDSKWRSAA